MTSNLSAIGGGTNLSRVVARQRATICRSNRAGLDFRVSCRALSRDNARYVSASYEINGFDSSDNARCRALSRDNARCRALSRVVARQRAQSECTLRLNSSVRIMQCNSALYFI